MSRVLNYKLVEAPTAFQLELEVRKCLESGWHLHGQPVMMWDTQGGVQRNTRLVQAMVRS